MTRLATHQLPAARLRAALDLGGLDALPDADLVERFARYGEHPAFDALLRRHGAMVNGVCRRVLANRADADDAFQATFLVLVRKAGSLHRADRLGPWLYGVAFRVAAKARTRAARLANRQTEATDMIPDPTAPADGPDWLPVLDAELAALPAKYREPLVLCELQGASRTAAAEALGIPEGTLSSRLARGRDLLRRRLLKHGTLLPAGGLAVLFATGGVGRAAISPALLAKTSEVVAAVATGAAAVGAVPAGAARLTDEVLKGMMLTKLRAGVGAVLAAVMVAGGVLAALPSDAPAQAGKPKPVAKAPDPRSQPAKPSTKGAALPDRDALQALWMLEKMEVGKLVNDGQKREANQMIEKMRFLIAGDVWWGMFPGQSDALSPMHATLDHAKNPKWLDLSDLGQTDDPTRCIYELDGDRLRIAMAEGSGTRRPPEFDAEEDTRLVVMTFRREKHPPAAGDKTLLGSWEQPFERLGVDEGKNVRTPIQRVEVLDGYLFALADGGRDQKWIGGKYTVDTTKNPKWIDVELVGGVVGDKELARLHGSYEVADGRLKLAFDTTGKRVNRPLELKSSAPDQILFFDVEATLLPREKILRESVPTPPARIPDRPKTVPPPTRRAPEPSATPPSRIEHRPAARVDDRPTPAPMPRPKMP